MALNKLFVSFIFLISVLSGCGRTVEEAMVEEVKVSIGHVADVQTPSRSGEGLIVRTDQGYVVVLPQQDNYIFKIGEEVTLVNDRHLQRLRTPSRPNNDIILNSSLVPRY